MLFAGSTTDPKSAYSYPLATEVMAVVEKERKDPKTLNVEQQESLISPSVNFSADYHRTNWKQPDQLYCHRNTTVFKNYRNINCPSCVAVAERNRQMHVVLHTANALSYCLEEIYSSAAILTSSMETRLWCLVKASSMISIAEAASLAS